MKIGVDATPLTQPMAGIGTCIFYWLDELLISRPQYRFILYAPTLGKDLEYFSRYPNVVIHTNPCLKQSHTIWGQTTLAYLLYRDRVDVFWATTQMVPFLKRKKMKILLTLYDFVYLLYPEMTSCLKGAIQRVFGARLLQHADAILPDSYGTAKRLKEYYGLDHRVVVEPPIKPYLKPIEASLLQPWLMSKNLHYKEYLLTIGTLEPRKNFEQVLTVFENVLSSQDPEKICPLIIMGGEGWKNSRLKKQLEDLKVRYPQKVITTGYASDEDQWRYLAGARYLIMLSHYEGYGMPVAEARVCGTEVICTDSPEMREAAQDQGVFLPLQEISLRLPPFFLRAASRPAIAQPPCYPTNSEKAARIAQVLDFISNA